MLHEYKAIAVFNAGMDVEMIDKRNNDSKE
jgi:hypothetical protein